MTSEQVRNIVNFEQGLKLGDPVIVRWTNCGHYYEANATIVRVNAKSVLTALSEHVPSMFFEGYPEGRHISAPRLADFKKWSGNNGVFPP